jgi:DNA-binding CsgD family transcriptional regulator
MLEPIREFGLEQLALSGETESIAARHADWCVSLAEEARRSGQLSRSGGLLALEAEHPNLRAALGWLLAHGEAVTALHLAGQLAEFWLRHGHLAEGEAWLERALAADAGAATPARAEALVGLNMLQWPRLAFARAEDLLAEAEAVARAAGDPGALAHARLHQGYAAAFQGKFDLAQARGEELLATYEAIPQGFGRHAPLWLLARASLEKGDDERATEGFAALLASGRAAGDDVSIANGLQGLAALAERRGEFARGLAGYAEAAAVSQRTGDRLHASLCLHGAAVCALELGQPDAAVRLFAAAESLRAASGASEFLYQTDQLNREQPLAEARAALGEVRFGAAWDAGLALSCDEAVAVAMALSAPPKNPASTRTATLESLTEREKDVLRLLVRGLSDKEIAAALGVSRRTASSQVAAIRAKLDAPSRSAAAAIAVRDRLV